MTSLSRVVDVVQALQGYLIDGATLSMSDGHDSLNCVLRAGPDRQAVVLSFSRIYFLSISKPGEVANLLLDTIKAQMIPSTDEHWPFGLPIESVRLPDMPELIWVFADGGLRMHVVSSVVTVLTEAV